MPYFSTRKIFACLSLLLASETALAGSLSDPVIDAPVEVIIADDQPYWEGAYIGATLGYNFSGGDRIGVTQTSGPNLTLGQYDNSGWAGSLRAGYRWQLDRWIFGPEIAVEGGKVEDSFTSAGYSGTTKLNHALSLRLKAGYVWPVLNSIVYGTVGLSRAELDYSVTGSGSSGAIAIDDTYASNGYILGFGIEQPLTERLSVTGEYEYMNYGKDTLSDGLGNSTIATPLFHSVKVGLNLRF
ncbi:outer membrane beta-barrel protein [Aliiroseovarius sp. S1339]|uniref:outer membrane protein n=1 Tax=Aliiroseovarius sp. S1339 TaxID=2936990 RepID=UPI0020BE06D9|nr:outer membrane beta-barrel protein [Aliiroseovarius sp. S1339]MCK8465226.1 outer membrane beta-barrel protein [Aliiroseovarius sp. S1339]